MATYHYIQQRTREWHQLHLGMPTSSEFEKIVTPKKLAASAQDQKYMNRLLAEWIEGEAIVTELDTHYINRGRDEEEAAFSAFEFHTDRKVTRVGFITTDDRVMGCSPDGLVGDDATLEIKVPSSQVHVGYLIAQMLHEDSGTVADDYLIQTQGQLGISERDKNYVFSYHPNIAPSLIETGRDEKVIKAIDSLVRAFSDRMMKMREELESRFGPFIREEPKSSDLGGLGITDEMVAWFESDARFQ